MLYVGKLNSNIFFLNEDHKDTHWTWEKMEDLSQALKKEIEKIRKNNSEIKNSITEMKIVIEWNK